MTEDAAPQEWEPTARLRARVTREGHSYIVEQLWRCVATGEQEWRHLEKVDCDGNPL